MSWQTCKVLRRKWHWYTYFRALKGWMVMYLVKICNFGSGNNNNMVAR
jgi:hypothetical protein